MNQALLALFWRGFGVAVNFCWQFLRQFLLLLAVLAALLATAPRLTGHGAEASPLYKEAEEFFSPEEESLWCTPPPERHYSSLKWSEDRFHMLI